MILQEKIKTNFDDTELIDKIEQLKKEKNAILLAHFYVDEKIQDIADYVGDSLGLSQKLSKQMLI